MSSTDKQADSQKMFDKSEPRFRNKSASEYMDPCQDFADRSIKCMRRNNGDRDMCTDYFQAYRDCKKAWLNQKKTKGTTS
ncbi:cytochrome c oxidase-assembly factor COX23, mitochondrial [Trichophyton rubrum MR1459]|uniref:Cytochrome c oxidase-assembly factor COX23 n=2 Tax=Arthrodermataceae TaxID=34384 RepID=E4UW84_ARTGP|nr:cytochrome c oxidase-assembly factor COX23 [Nannizzia gypsea CBS 118893]XP_003236874.1 cytochrome c oxidase-assembly factor COX23, mitochondrial [Trichophyton rubrum CBS 118892]EZF92819.1 cytochrome c oxidase-assembly factor COX23, mitochondrial [Trichophyton rubrum MR1459]EZG03829.1 cytochrome c oxidase-assembly factor COX23, mitochondrial [Trichophyton rubrum CBS 735.88]KMQ44841.1 Cysteine alpha-hairpin motif superfamily [Trichophyton rubrum]EFR01692.1 cytochrome c oxidase-assembly factor